MPYAAFPNLAKPSHDIAPQGDLIRSPVLDGFMWLTHGVTTRKFAGPETGTFDLMEDVRRRLVPGASRLFCGEQVHGGRVEVIDSRRRYAGADKVKTRGPIVQLLGTDALIAHDPAFPVAVQTADCVPLLLVDLRKRRIAAVHAGWRSSLARIAGNAVAAMVGQGSDVEDIVAWMGPTISRTAYAVDAELAARFRTAFPDCDGILSGGRLDLVLLNAYQLKAAGIPPAQIHAANLCTAGNLDTCYSYRAEGKAAGRMVLYAMVLLTQPFDGKQ